jgi:ApaG protein
MGSFPAKGAILPFKRPDLMLYATRDTSTIQHPQRVPHMSASDKYRIEVEASVDFIPDQSDPGDDRYVFAYHITIKNAGSAAAQLISRHWVITNGAGSVQEVRGEGVIGEQPRLAPGDQYRYSSGSVLETPVGAMHGSYQMVAEDGHRFEAPIPPFTLAVPRALH